MTMNRPPMPGLAEIRSLMRELCVTIRDRFEGESAAPDTAKSRPALVPGHQEIVLLLRRLVPAPSPRRQLASPCPVPEPQSVSGPQAPAAPVESVQDFFKDIHWGGGYTGPIVPRIALALPGSAGSRAPRKEEVQTGSFVFSDFLFEHVKAPSAPASPPKAKAPAERDAIAAVEPIPAPVDMRPKNSAVAAFFSRVHWNGEAPIAVPAAPEVQHELPRASTPSENAVSPATPSPADTKVSVWSFFQRAAWRGGVPAPSTEPQHVLPDTGQPMPRSLSCAVAEFFRTAGWSGIATVPAMGTEPSPPLPRERPPDSEPKTMTASSVFAGFAFE